MSPQGASPAMASPDVFLSYARENRPAAAELAEALAAEGLTVWWDRDLLAGAEFAAVIERELAGAAVVVVLWSADSVRSAFVRDECSRALRAGKLLPLRIEAVELPLGFGQLHTLDLLDWDGDTDAESFQALVLEVRRRVSTLALAGGGAGRALADPTPAPRSSRWSARRRRFVGVGLALALVLTGGAYVVKRSADRQQEQAQRDAADRHFRAGLEFQYAAVPRLENALNEYLSALERRPNHARAHYYLGHVYAQTGRPVDALASFRIALGETEAPLDRGQREAAQAQVLALARVDGEAAPMTRARAAGGADTSATASIAPGAETPARPSPPAVRGPTVGAIHSAPRAGATSVLSVPSAVPAPPAPKSPPRIAPSAAQLVQLVRRVDDLFAADEEQRINATTALVIDPEALSDAVPLAVDKALRVLGEPVAARGAAASAGVIGTLVLLHNALPGTLEENRAAIEALVAATGSADDYTRQQAAQVAKLLAQAAGRKPLAYIQIAHAAQRPLAEAIATRLRRFGYDTPAIEDVGARAPDATQLRVQGKSERGYTRWIAKVIGEITGAAPQVNTLRSARPGVDTYEIWLGRDLCGPTGRRAPGCAPS